MSELGIETEQRIFDNDDSVGNSLNNLHVLLYGEEEYLKNFNLSDAKVILRQAYVDYEILLKHINLNNEHNFRMKKSFDILKDKNRDNLE